MKRVYAKNHDVTKDVPENRAGTGPRGAEKGFGQGIPLYLKKVRLYPKTAEGRSNPLEQEARHAADAVRRDNAVATERIARQGAGGGGTVGAALSRGLGSYGSGQPLVTSTRADMEERFGADFSAVRIHNDSTTSRIIQGLGARAVTTGNDIYLNNSGYSADSSAGKSLLAHELTHVVQQGGTTGQVQFDLMQTLPSALGYFEIEMATRGAPRPGMEGHIRFFPDPNGPYSAEIGLIQAVNFTDVGGRTGAPGAPVDWSGIAAAAGPGAEAGRNELMTTGTGAAPQGWMIDANTAANARGDTVGPNYIQHWLSPPADNRFGWLRSPTDTGDASLYDYPWFSFDVDFEFETVAKATDTQTVYGALDWGFGIRSGVVQGEYAAAYGTESATFNEALERFRGYYTHEPIVLYFDTGSPLPSAGEEAKITGVLDYLNRYPDVRLQIDGYADERGSEALNSDLSQSRADNVEALAIALGVDPNRIDWAAGWGETTGFAAGSREGSWRANRRVVITFVRTASTPIVMP